jgi:hypothetical protein
MSTSSYPGESYIGEDPSGTPQLVALDSQARVRVDAAELTDIAQSALVELQSINELLIVLGPSVSPPVIGPQGPQGIQGPQGPPGPSGTDRTQVTLVNKDSVILPPGYAVMLDVTGVGVVRWDGTRRFVGLVAVGSAPTYACVVQVAGAITLDWTAATGAPFLGTSPLFCAPSSPGGLITVPPGIVGQMSQLVGAPVAPDTLDINPQSPILL